MNHFSYPLTIVQINIFGRTPKYLFPTKIPDPKLSSQPPPPPPPPPPIFSHRVPPGAAGQIDYNTRTVTGTSKNVDIKFMKENPVLKPEVIKDIIIHRSWCPLWEYVRSVIQNLPGTLLQYPYQHWTKCFRLHFQYKERPQFVQMLS